MSLPASLMEHSGRQSKREKNSKSQRIFRVCGTLSSNHDTTRALMNSQNLCLFAQLWAHNHCAMEGREDQKNPSFHQDS